MAVEAHHLTTSGSGSTTTSYNTASVSPSANRLILVFTRAIVASGTSNQPTVTGNGLTYDNIFSQVRASGNARLCVFRAQGASPSAGAININFGAQSQIGVFWSVVEFSNVPSGSNGADAIVASNIKGADAASVTMDAFQNAINAVIGCMTVNSNTNIVAGSGFTELGEYNSGSPQFSGQTQFKNEPDTSVDWSGGTQQCVALELINIDSLPKGGYIFIQP